MGNRSTTTSEAAVRKTSTEPATKTKLDDYDNPPDIYRIINPKGGGQLVDLAWLAHRTHNLGLIDAYIQNELVKYVLNNGKGEQVKETYFLKAKNFLK